MNSRVKFSRMIYIGILTAYSSLLGAACGGGGGHVDRSALDDLGVMIASQSTSIPFSTVLDAGPNVMFTEKGGRGSSAASDAVILAKIVDVRGSYSLAHSQDPVTEKWTTVRAKFGAPQTVPVVELDLEVTEILGGSRRFLSANKTSSVLSVEFGPPPENADPKSLIKEFTELGDQIVVFLRYSVRDLAGEPGKPHLEPILFGAAVGGVRGNGMLSFPAIERLDPSLLGDGITLDELRASLAEPRTVPMAVPGRDQHEEPGS